MKSAVSRDCVKSVAVSASIFIAFFFSNSAFAADNAAIDALKTAYRYELGNGVKQDVNEAVKWRLIAAKTDPTAGVFLWIKGAGEETIEKIGKEKL